MNKLILSVLSVLFVMHSLLAQVPLTGTTPYTQSFNTLATGGNSNPWSDNTTIPGWYAAFTNSGNSTTAATAYIADAGTSATGGLHSYGAASNTERALGSVGSGSAKAIYYGVLLTNNTASDIKALSITYKGEQWRSSTSTQNLLAFAYKVGATSVSETGYNTVSYLNFVGAAPASSAGALDGNVGAMSISNIIRVSLPVGQSIMLRWMDVDDTGSDAGLSIDDLTVSVVTTPFLVVNPSSLSGLGYTGSAGPSAPATFTVSGDMLTPAAPVTVTPAPNFAVSTDNATFTTDPLSLTPANDGSLNQTIYTRLVAGLATGAYSGTATISSADVSSAKTVSLSGNVYPAGAAGPCGISTLISAIRTAPDGGTFTATGVVTSAIGTNIYIQDGTGGILLYTGTGTSIDLPEVEIGDEVQVTGVLTTYNTDRELKNFTACFIKTSTPNTIPTPVSVTPATLCNHVGELITLANVTTISGSGNFSGNANYTLSDGTGSVVMRIQNGTNLVGATRPSGTVNITGVVSLFNNACQLLPRSIDDVPGSTASTANCPGVGDNGGIVADNTLDIAWWNVEWLGNTGYGPTNEAQQQANVAQQLTNMNQDIYCLEEVTDLTKLDAIISTLNANTGKTYARACGEVPARTPPIYYSHWFDIPEVPGDASTYAQKVCFVYNTALVSNESASQILDFPSSLSTSAWASNRFPLLMNCDVTIAGITKNLKLVGLHAKSGSDQSSYMRRQADFASLKDYLDTTYPTDNVMIMGDYNDDADQSIYVDATTSTTFVSSFNNFVSSPDYTVITKQLSNCTISSTASYPDIIDHLTVSNEIVTNGTTPANGISYLVNSTKKFSPIVGNSTTTSDHFPIGARFQFFGPMPVDLVSFTGQANEKAIALNWVTAWEKQNVGFDVLKSSTTKNFEKVGYVAGNTTTNAQSIYAFTDKDVQAGQLYYYQLKQKDVDGGSTLSKIIAVRAGIESTDTEPFVYPNPNLGNFILSAKNLEATSIKLYNALGAEIPVIAKKDQNSGEFSISSTSPLAPGLYHLRLQTAKGTYQKTVKVLVR